MYLENFVIPQKILNQIIKDNVFVKLTLDLVNAKTKPPKIIMMLVSTTVNFPAVIPDKRKQIFNIFDKNIPATEKKTEINDYLKLFIEKVSKITTETVQDRHLLKIGKELYEIYPSGDLINKILQLPNLARILTEL